MISSFNLNKLFSLIFYIFLYHSPASRPTGYIFMCYGCERLVLSSDLLKSWGGGESVTVTTRSLPRQGWMGGGGGAP